MLERMNDLALKNAIPNEGAGVKLQQCNIFGLRIACALLLAASQANAQPYAGIGAGAAQQSTLCAAGAPCSNSKPGLKLFAGYQLDGPWVGELAYMRGISKFTASDSNATQVWFGSYQAQALGASAGYNFSLGPVQWQARAGLAFVQAEFLSATAGVPNSRDSTVQPLLGLGLRHSLSPSTALRFDLDVTRSKAYTRSGNFSLLTVGIEQRF
jgi:Outer membrane protein beta-barrel domain